MAETAVTSRVVCCPDAARDANGRRIALVHFTIANVRNALDSALDYQFTYPSGMPGGRGHGARALSVPNCSSECSMP